MTILNKKKYLIIIVISNLLIIACAWNVFSNSYSNHLYPFKQNNKWGYIDYDGNVIIKPQYDEAGEFSYGVALVTVLDPDYMEGDIPFYGFINTKGEWVVEPKLYYARPFSEELAVIETDSHDFCFINVRGEVVLPLQEIAHHFSEGLAVQLDYKTGKAGYIDKSGNWIIRPQFRIATSFSEGLAIVCERSYGYINQKGEVVIPMQYYHASDFHDGVAWVKYSQKESGFYINIAGERVEGLNLPYIGKYFCEGVTFASIDKKYYGYVNTKGEWIIKPIYTKADNFSEGLAFVKTEDKCYFIDKKGSIKISLEGMSSCISGFKNGLARVYKDKKEVFINTEGKVVFTVQ